MKRIFSLFAAVVLSHNLYASAVDTPGAIASLPIPEGSEYQYLQANDASLMQRGTQTQFLVSVLPNIDPLYTLQALLSAMGAEEFISQIKEETIAGHRAVSVHAKQDSSDWIMVIKHPELNLLVRIKDVTNAKQYHPYVVKLLKTIRFAPASYPSIVTGHYRISSDYSAANNGGVGVFAQNSVSLKEKGVYQSASMVGYSGAGVGDSSKSQGNRGWWQVRGNRLLTYEPPDDFINYRFEAFSNGLELYDENNTKLLWVRK